MDGEAGFTRFRRATETPFNIVYEAKCLRSSDGLSTRGSRRH